jgi:hypothetical protein
VEEKRIGERGREGEQAIHKDEEIFWDKSQLVRSYGLKHSRNNWGGWSEWRIRRKREDFFWDREGRFQKWR